MKPGMRIFSFCSLDEYFGWLMPWVELDIDVVDGKVMTVWVWNFHKNEFDTIKREDSEEAAGVLDVYQKCVDRHSTAAIYRRRNALFGNMRLLQ